MVDAATFAPKNDFPIASVAELYANRPAKEALIRAQQQKQLLEGLQGFGQGVDSLVKRRMEMASALATQQYLGMGANQDMTSEQSVGAFKAKSGEADFGQAAAVNYLLQHPEAVNDPRLQPTLQKLFPKMFSAAAATATPAANDTPAQVAPPVLGAPQLASASSTLTGGLPDATTAQAPVQSAPPSPLELMSGMKVGKGTLGAIKTFQSQNPHNVLVYKPGKGVVKVGEAGKGDQVINETPRGAVPLSEDRASLKYIEDFNKDSGVVRAKQGLDGAENVRQLATSGNPIAAAAIPTYMARASGEVGNLSEPDKKPFGGSRAILARVEASLKQLATGQLSEQNKGFLLELSQIMEKSANKNLDRRGREMAKQFATVHKLHPEDVFSSLRPDSNFIERADGNIRKTSEGVVYEVLP